MRLDGDAARAIDEIIAGPLVFPETASEDGVDLSSFVDARASVVRTIKERRGQRAFREKLIEAYRGACAVTGCRVPDLLEAAHILPYRGPHTNDTTNGLLLRTDIHTLFDCGLISVAPESMTLLVSTKLAGSGYDGLAGCKVYTPTDISLAPSAAALSAQRARSGL
jgi:predicted restriction endonuclease